MVVVHIGLMKTASTSLQDLIAMDTRIESRIHDPRYYNYSKVGVQEVFEKPIFVSDENLSREYHKVNSLKESIEKIQSYHKVDKYLVIIRNQKSFLESAYKHHIKQTDDIDDFDTWLQNPAGRSQLNLCKFYDFITDLEQLVGKDKIVIVLFESIIKDQKKFLGGFYEMFSLSPIDGKTLPKSNSAFNEAYYKAKLSRNKLVSKFPYLKKERVSKWMIRILSRVKRRAKFDVWTSLESSSAKELITVFKSQNASLNSSYSVDLKAYKYDFYE